ncbi:hypothetical protein GCM10010168_10370 [Actinoplanes ianthinogenes]|uniref:Uncharacterized protein n=1 Tax=Actinoplanes ianthinogenes TaxID=122358 RepID=A0ABM7LY33_9ACTN|nr:hypothetical protein [Actinoplanes ianthinogenes]BCJ44224.1 hypothetical protein Aiant_48810 [Actinoplanes ianthinogenes]GGQ96611.1 hypothetical protein GCM10010168_10370 [Actinoplanes ianthinogenes]
MRYTPMAAVVAAVLLIGAGASTRHDDPEVAVEATLAGQGTPAKLGVGGFPVTGLYPGAEQRMTVMVHNPYRFPVTLTAVSGKVTAVNRKGCTVTSADLTIGRYAGKPALPARIGSGRLIRIGYLPVRMPRTVANACQGATFTLRLSITARKASK